jgi:hypothetical protein
MSEQPKVAMLGKAHAVFDPVSPRRSADVPASEPRTGSWASPARLANELRTFYQHPLSWQILLVTSIMLCYVGGAAMFWFHAIALNEGGPAISPYAHWLLDSTFGFIALTPVLFLLIPFAAWAADRLADGRDAQRPFFYIIIAGGMFAFITIPGPLGHDLLVARGTWIANTATALIGNAAAPAPPPKSTYPLVAVLTQQLGFGIPTYLLSVTIALVMLRVLATRRRRAIDVETRAVHQARHAQPQLGRLNALDGGTIGGDD